MGLKEGRQVRRKMGLKAGKTGLKEGRSEGRWV